MEDASQRWRGNRRRSSERPFLYGETDGSGVTVRLPRRLGTDGSQTHRWREQDSNHLASRPGRACSTKRRSTPAPKRARNTDSPVLGGWALVRTDSPLEGDGFE